VAIISDLAHVIKTPIVTAAFNLNAISIELRRARERRSWFRAEAFRASKIEANLQFIRRSLLGINIPSRTFAAIAQSLCRQSKPSPHRERCILRQLLEELLNEIALVLPSGEIDLTTARDCHTAHVLLDTPDASLVKTAIYNIIQNALKFKYSGTQVEVRLSRSEEQLVIEVQDSGVGITEEDKPRIFDPGFTRRAPGHASGTGMGLTIAKETFDRLGWHIDVRSTSGVGTTVSIHITNYAT
jgi:signal transduction histidine kinase